MTPAQEFREARDWLAQHKRDPFLWLIILMTLTLFALNFGSNLILWSAFPPSDAKKAIGQVLPNGDVSIGRQTRILCKLPRGTYIFGYDFKMAIDGADRLGRICRDVVSGGWVFAFDDAKFNSR